MDSGPWFSLQVREPGHQYTVSFGLKSSDVVLWAAYPRREDGAKIVILPKTFRLLPDSDQAELLNRLRVIAPMISIAPAGLFQLPMHLLATDDRLSELKALLESAQAMAERHRPRAAEHTLKL